MTMLAVRAAASRGWRARESAHAEVTLVSKMWRYSSSLNASARLRTLVPTLFTSTSSLSQDAGSESSSAARPASVATSAATTCSRPAARASTRRGGRSSIVRATAATSAPKSRNCSVTAHPMPLVPPVTRARRPARVQRVIRCYNPGFVPRGASRHTPWRCVRGRRLRRARGARFRGECSSGVERLTVAQEVAGSRPVTHPSVLLAAVPSGTTAAAF
jgi:hypothetical protein